jgi:hypothetical protein
MQVTSACTSRPLWAEHPDSMSTSQQHCGGICDVYVAMQALGDRRHHKDIDTLVQALFQDIYTPVSRSLTTSPSLLFSHTLASPLTMVLPHDLKYALGRALSLIEVGPRYVLFVSPSSFIFQKTLTLECFEQQIPWST